MTLNFNWANDKLPNGNHLECNPTFLKMLKLKYEFFPI